MRKGTASAARSPHEPGRATVPENAPRVLIADDQPDVLEALRFLLKQAGYQVEAANSPEAVLEALQAREFDLVLMDLNYARDTTSGREGLDLVRRIRAVDGALPVVAMTAWGSIDLAVEAMRKGVKDFVLKPWENDRLLATLGAQVEQAQALRKARQLEAQELEAAQEIQHGLLPRDITSLAGYDIASVWRPARAVGGDYFDVFKLGTSDLALCIADGMGKGMPAALLMSNLQAAIKSAASEWGRPGELCSKINRLLLGNLDGGRFITFFYACLEGKGGRLVYTNAGHNAPILTRADGSTLRLEGGGPALGLLSHCRFDVEEVRLAGGDRLALFTDGVTEARNANGEEFGEKRLITLLRENRRLGARELEGKILESVAGFSGGFHDDATLIVVAAL